MKYEFFAEKKERKIDADGTIANPKINSFCDQRCSRVRKRLSARFRAVTVLRCVASKFKGGAIVTIAQVDRPTPVSQVRRWIRERRSYMDPRARWFIFTAMTERALWNRKTWTKAGAIGSTRSRHCLACNDVHRYAGTALTSKKRRRRRRDFVYAADGHARRVASSCTRAKIINYAVHSALREGAAGSFTENAWKTRSKRHVTFLIPHVPLLLIAGPARRILIATDARVFRRSVGCKFEEENLGGWTWIFWLNMYMSGYIGIIDGSQ